MFALLLIAYVISDHYHPQFFKFYPYRGGPGAELRGIEVSKQDLLACIYVHKEMGLGTCKYLSD